MTYFTDKLKELRKEKKLTQKEIAEQIGIKQNSYRKPGKMNLI